MQNDFGRALDRYITGNYGEDMFKGWCEVCEKPAPRDNDLYDEKYDRCFCSKECKELFHLHYVQ